MEMLAERGEKIAVYVAGVMSDLVDEGLLERPGERWSLSTMGLWKYDQLRASGFRPTREEIGAALVSFDKIAHEPFPTELADMVHRWDEIKVQLALRAAKITTEWRTP
jgi:hypothetical protein